MEVLAPAKINLGLSVLGRMPNGYHDIHTLFAALEMGDRIRIEPSPQGIQLEVVGSNLSAGPDNLIYQAAQAYLEAVGWPGGIRITLDKRLPIAAGLGGGSSDAATVLRALSEIYPVYASLDLSAIAQNLGADVSFFLRPGLSEGRGIGDRLRVLEPINLHLVLLNPAISVMTAWAYKYLGPSEWQHDLNVAAIIQALRAGDEPPYWNTLERPVFRLEPSLAELKEELQKAGLSGSLLSGSGATLFGIAKDADHAAFVAQQLQARFPHFWIRATRTVGKEYNAVHPNIMI